MKDLDTPESDLEVEEAAEDPGAEVELEPKAEEYDENAKNLVPFFLGSEAGKVFLADLAKRVTKECDAAVENSENQRTERKRVWEMLAGRRKRANGPWEHCADPKTFIALERVHRLSSRFYVEIFASNPNIFVVNKNGPDDGDAIILTEHSNWQFREEQTDFLPHQRRALMIYTALGTVYFKSGRDFARNRNRHSTLTGDDLILPFAYTAVEVDLSDMPWKAEVLRLYRDEVEAREDDGDFANLDKVLERADSHDDDPITESARVSMANLTGIMPDDDKESSASPFFFLEYHGTAKLPGDEKRRPVCVTVHPKTQAVVKLYIREEEDWKDRVRFDQQLKQLELYQQAVSQYDGVMSEYQQAATDWELSGGAMMGAPQPEMPMMAAPPPPSWLAESIDGQPAPVRKVPMELYTRADFVPNIPDMEGIGFGNILVSLEETANTALAHFLDAAELGNASMFVSAEGVMPKKDTKFGPGVHLRLQNISPEQVQTAIKELRATNANPQLMETARYLSDVADSAIAAPAVLSGEPGKSGETAQGISLRAEMAAKQLTAGALTYITALSNIARNNAKLNALFMRDEEVFRVSGKVADPQRIKRSMYQRDFNISFTADTRLVGQIQRIAEKDQLVAMAGQIPYLQSNAAFVYEAVKQALEARGATELVEMMGARPEPPPMFGQPPAPPPGVVPPGAPGAGPPADPGAQPQGV